MALDKIITRSFIAAAVLWTIAGAGELLTGHHGRSAAYAGVAIVALIVEAGWSALRRI